MNADFLESKGVDSWTDLPVWVPPDSAFGGFTSIDSSKALSAGLTFRPLEETVQDTLAWYRAQEPVKTAELKAGLTADREAALLQEWHQMAKSR